ncbi:hypothetical protein ACFL6U_06290 [Planctomycetota bacterium]
MPIGTTPKLSKNQKRIYEAIDSDTTRSQWQDWHWQMRHCIRDLGTFQELLEVTLDEATQAAFKQTINRFPMSITPYYLSLINTDDLHNDPVFLQSFPSPLETRMTRHDMADPLHEDHDSPVPGLIHRYPDRVLLLVSNMCSMYCRHCTRKRRVGDVDSIPDNSELQQGIDYIRRTPQVRDVLLSQVGTHKQFSFRGPGLGIRNVCFGSLIMVLESPFNVMVSVGKVVQHTIQRPRYLVLGHTVQAKRQVSNTFLASGIEETADDT